MSRALCTAPATCQIPGCAETRERRERRYQRVRDFICTLAFLALIGGSILAHGIR